MEMEIILPDEIHDFLRYQSWITVSRAITDYLSKELQQKP